MKTNYEKTIRDAETLKEKLKNRADLNAIADSLLTKQKLTINLNDMTLRIDNKKTVQYKSEHAFKTALTVWLLMNFYKEEV